MHTRSKICFINTASIWGGGENWQYETLLDIKDRHTIVSISNPKGALFKKLKSNNISCYPLSLKSLSILNPLAWIKCYRLMKKIAPSTIMFNTSADFKVFSLVAKWAGVKNILYRRDNGSAIKPSLINQFLLKRITFFLPCSEFIGQIANAKKNNLIPRKKMVIIPNSISLEAWDSKVTAPQKLSTGKGIVKLGCIGRLSKEKGQHFLPKIAEELRQTEKNFKIFIAGTGPAEDELKKEIIHLGLEKHFELLGFVKSNKAFVEAIDCLLLPSMWEGLPTTALEAMAGSKPVLAFSVAGNPEVVLHKQTGLLIKPFETATFAHEIKGLINNPKTMTEMGKKGRELVEKKYSKAITNQQLNPFFI